MKIIPFPPLLINRSVLIAASVGCALATLPLTPSARAQETAAEAAPRLSGMETGFVKEAASGNMAEVKMGEIALQNAESADIKEFAQMMIKDHTAANEDLMALARERKIELPTAPRALDQEMAKKMRAMKGEAFDKAYMMHAVTDHTKDVADYKKAQASVKDPALKAYVDKVEPIIASHLDKSKELAAKMKK